MKRALQAFVNDYVKEIEEGNAAIFAGAGLSVPAGFVNWKGLLRPLANELDIDIDMENDLVALAQYHYNQHQNNRHKINQIIFDEFSRTACVTTNHKILAKLPIGTYWTTNYDNLIETSLNEEGKVPDVKYTVDQLAMTKPKRDAVVYKMHGDKEHPSDAVIIRDDYERYHLKMAPFITALSGDLISKTFLFLGFSFTDPNVDYILARVRSTYEENQRRHYCFVKKVQTGDYKTEAEQHYYEKKQEFFTQDLQRFNIKPLFIDDYDEITHVLWAIEKRIHRNNLFISGSAAGFGEWSIDKAEGFISTLSSKLIDHGFNIVSGFGLGVGSLIISGVLEEVFQNKGIIDNERLLLRPFPQRVRNSVSRDTLWHKYREDMISRTGISIFLFGNKVEDGKIVNASGLKKEFEITRNLGNHVIPVGATGFMAKELWEEVNADFDSFFEQDVRASVKPLFDALNDTSLTNEELISIIIRIIDTLKGVN